MRVSYMSEITVRLRIPDEVLKQVDLDKVVERLERGEHKTREGFIAMIKLVYSSEMGKGKSHRKHALKEIIEDLTESSEAIRRGSAFRENRDD